MSFWLLRHIIRLWPPGLLLFALMMRERKPKPLDLEVKLGLFMFNSGIDRHGWRDLAGVRRQCRRRLRRSSPDTAVAYVSQLAMLLQRRQAPEMALAVIEGYLDVVPTDYPEADVGPTQALAAKIQRRLADVDFPAACMLVMTWVNVCMHAGSRGGYAADALIRAFFDLDGDAGDSERLIGVLKVRTEGMDDVPAMMLIVTLAAAIIGLGRRSEGIALYLWFFGIEPEDLEESAALTRRIRQRLEGFNPAAYAIMVATVPVVLHPVLDRGVVIELIEGLYGITPDLYDAPARLAETLGLVHAPESAVRSDQAFGTAFALNEALQFSRRFEHSRAVLRAILINEHGAPDDTGEILRRLPAFIEGLDRHHRPSFLKLVMHNFFRSGELEVAATFMQGRLGIDPGDYTAGSGRLADRIRKAHLGFSPEDETFLVGHLFGCLIDTEGREGDAFKLLDAYLWDVVDVEALVTSKPVAVEGICHLLMPWFEISSPDVAFARCATVVRFLRRCLELRGIVLEDRTRFVQDLATLRRRIVQTGRDRARRHPDVWLDVLRWDVELGQRLLFERYRFLEGDGASLLRVAETAEQPRLGWSLRRIRPDLDRPVGGATDLSERPRPHCFGYESGTPRSTAATDGVRGAARAPMQEARFAEVQALLTEGVREGQLASAIGPEAVWLRIGVLSGENLYWDAYRADGLRLTRVAGSVGGTSAHAQIDRAVAWHDRLITRLWAEHEGAEPQLRQAAGAARLPVQDIVSRLRGRNGSPPPDQDDLARISEDFRLAIARSMAEHWVEEWIASVIPDDWAAALRDRPEALRRDWELLAAILAAINRRELERSLDLVTDDFLRRVSAHLDLTPLAQHLGGEIDLIVEVEGPLHAVPVSLLPFGEGRLFERVRSVRTTLSLLVDLLRPRSAPIRTEPAEKGTLLTVSWFAEDDPAAAGAAWLHRGQEFLAERHDLDWRSASDDPAGGPALIRAALASRAEVRLLTVCGHGALHGPGVRLVGGELWTGQGCDFGGVTWLFLVSCSLGRVRHTETEYNESESPDVDGLIVRLVARRLASVLACRWPVHGLFASQFANLVAAEYLAPAAGDDGQPRRALALNRARAKTLGRGRTTALNTVAAFEIYGEG